MSAGRDLSSLLRFGKDLLDLDVGESQPLLGRQSPGSEEAREVKIQGDNIPPQPHGPCDIIVSDFHPYTRIDLIEKEMTGEAAFIRYQNQIFYFNKTTKKFISATENNATNLQLFDLQLGLHAAQQEKIPTKWATHFGRPTFSQPRRLTDRELDKLLFFWGIRHKPAPVAPAPLSSWHPKNGINLIVVDQDPETLDLTTLLKDTLEAFPFNKSVYLRFRDQLWQVKKNPNWFDKNLGHRGLFKKLGWFQQRKLIDNWHPKNGVDLIVVDKNPEDPESLDLNTLSFTNAAYLRFRDKLWYVKKNPSWFDRNLGHRWLFKKLGWFQQRQLLDKVQGRALARFDAGMKTAEKQHQHLTDEDMENVGVLTGHTHRTAWQKFLNGLGQFSVGFIAVGCGISTAAAFISLNIVTGGLASVIAAALFVAGTAVNWWIFKRYVGPVLISLFGREKFLVDEKGEDLRWPKKIAMGVAVALSVSVGITFAGLTYGSTLTLPAVFAFLGAISAALPPIAAILAGVTLICMTALMLKDIADLIKKKDVWGEIKEFLKNLVSTDPNLPQNKGKSHRRIVAERVATVVLTAAFIPLACFGLYMTMNACAPGVKDILMNGIPSVAEGLANVISLGLAFIGQIPFGIQTAFQTIGKVVPAASNWIANLFSKEKKLATSSRNDVVEANETAPQPDSTAWKATKLFFVAMNAIGNGLISMMGAVGSAFRWLALISGTANSAFAGTPAVLNGPNLPMVPGVFGDDLPDISKVKKEEKPKKGSRDDFNCKSSAAFTLSQLRKQEQEAASLQSRQVPESKDHELAGDQSPRTPVSPKITTPRPSPTSLGGSNDLQLDNFTSRHLSAGMMFDRRHQSSEAKKLQGRQATYDDMAVDYHSLRRPRAAT